MLIFRNPSAGSESDSSDTVIAGDAVLVADNGDPTAESFSALRERGRIEEILVPRGGIVDGTTTEAGTFVRHLVIGEDGERRYEWQSLEEHQEEVDRQMHIENRLFYPNGCCHCMRWSCEEHEQCTAPWGFSS